MRKIDVPTPTLLALTTCLALTPMTGCDEAEDDGGGTDTDGHTADDGHTDGGTSGDGHTDETGTGTATGEDTGTAALGVVSGTISYEGSEQGNLSVGLFLNNPPEGPPAVFPPFQAENPSFPVEYGIEEVPPGEYYVVGLLDFPADGETSGNNMPDDGEPYAVSEQSIVVEAGGAYEVDLTLTVE